MVTAGKDISIALLVTTLCTAGAVLVGAIAYLVSVDDPLLGQVADMLFGDDGRPEGFAYYETNPEYFDSLNWTTSPQQEDRSRANDDGSLSEWAERWYIAHRDSGYGEVMARLEPGAVVTIDGHSVQLKGRGMVDFPSKVAAVLALTGEDYEMVLLTCVNDGPTPDETKHLWVLWG